MFMYGWFWIVIIIVEIWEDFLSGKSSLLSIVMLCYRYVDWWYSFFCVNCDFFRVVKCLSIIYLKIVVLFI